MADENYKCTDYLGRTVIISEARAKRPRQFEISKPRKVVPPEKCYFCPGNEHMTPPETDRIPAEKSWFCRSFPNKFPAASPLWKEAYGHHEVIVETPDHEKRFSEIGEVQMQRFLLLLKRRVRALYKDKKVNYISVFKNEGLGAGASIEHSHTQLVALDFVPESIMEISRKQKEKEKYIKGAKKLLSNKHFFSCIPFCPRFHYETWIAPKKRLSCISKMNEKEIFSLSEILLKTIDAVDRKNSYPSYNILYFFAPPKDRKMSMHIEILPRLSTWAGFELAGSGYLNSVSPKNAHETLKQ
ncbi:hypothetical protein AUJ17_04210 [Candidatus Micrarchaeota archaeon CG1_02_47_40]|nr:MAG: hypothetical protein AUJ17_04210 [Candidatus Micrarchaeota archaeon CG1_02_47_40]QBM01439.1 hypothetical protein [uncultured archaeon]